MKQLVTVGLAMLAGAALGAAAVQGLHAQAKPPIYVIGEADVSNQDAFMKEYATPASAMVKAAGGRFLVQGGKTQSLEGEPPKNRIVVTVWDSMEQIQAFRASASRKELLPIRDKYAKVRAYAVEGVAQ